MTPDQKNPTPVCQMCQNESEPGRIETDNNGPIVDCPMCTPTPSAPVEDEKRRALYALESLVYGHNAADMMGYEEIRVHYEIIKLALSARENIEGGVLALREMIKRLKGIQGQSDECMHTVRALAWDAISFANTAISGLLNETGAVEGVTDEN